MRFDASSDGFQIGKNCRIDPTAVIDVKQGFIGDGALILGGARIEGTRVEIGREAFIDRGATIGGGSCFDPGAFLVAGDWFHMGVNSHINIARGVTIGHEFGCGVETKIFTHGAYIDSYNLGAPVEWAPVEIGDSVWLPNAWVNPGVDIGANVVVAARSLVNRSLPAGCLAAGIPARPVRENAFPRQLGADEKRQLIATVVDQAWSRFAASAAAAARPEFHLENDDLVTGLGSQQTRFELQAKRISGAAGAWALLLKDQLRRNGIRFRYQACDGVWVAWKTSRSEI